MKLSNPNKRSTEEWIGRTLDTPFPDYVRLRIAERENWICQCGCGRKIYPTRDAWNTDHKTAIVNGGENRESNGTTLLAKHHLHKTKADLAEKSERYAKQRRHFGMKRGGTIPYRRFNGQPVDPRRRNV